MDASFSGAETLMQIHSGWFMYCGSKPYEASRVVVDLGNSGIGGAIWSWERFPLPKVFIGALELWLK